MPEAEPAAKGALKFTNVHKMPTGAMVRIDPGNGRLGGLAFGYFVPLASNLTRHLLTFARAADNVRFHDITQRVDVVSLAACAHCACYAFVLSLWNVSDKPTSHHISAICASGVRLRSQP